MASIAVAHPDVPGLATSGVRVSLGANRRLLIVVNDAGFLVSHRWLVATGAMAAGYEVHVASPAGPAVSLLTEHGIRHHALELHRSSLQPRKELQSLTAMFRLFRRLRPDVLHLVTPKPVLYGSLLARLTPVHGVVVAISGLGTVFSSGGLKANLLRRFVLRLYRFGFGHPNLRIIFQNSSDRDLVLAAGAAAPEQIVMIRGSGVSLLDYSYEAEPDSTPVVTFAARLLASKGVREFIQAARIVRDRGISAKFVLAGATDPGNPETVRDAELQGWAEEGVVSVEGYRTDIPALFRRSHIVALPSYYGEGIPKVLIEAAASGRAVVTTDMPGCREAIVPDVTGILVPPRDPVALANAFEQLIRDPVRRMALGRAGRVLAEQAYDVQQVVSTHLDIYEELIARHDERAGESRLAI
jgi:glycosyltransferase involved in cell wall biosynthesis